MLASQSLTATICARIVALKQRVFALGGLHIERVDKLCIEAEAMRGKPRFAINSKTHAIREKVARERMITSPYSLLRKRSSCSLPAEFDQEISRSSA